MATSSTDWYLSKLQPLKESLGHLFPSASLQETTDASRLVRPDNGATEQPLAAIRGEYIDLFIYPGIMKGAPCAAVQIHTTRPPMESDLRISRAFSHVYNRDLRWCGTNPSQRRDGMWEDLRPSQFTRAIARYISPENPRTLERWIRTAEAAINLTYEGSSARPCIVFYGTEDKAGRKLRENFIHLATPISAKELFENKWIRGMVEGQRVALVGDLKSSNLIGLTSPTSIDEAELSRRLPMYAPHYSLRLIPGILGSSGIALITTDQNDLFLLTSADVAFHKTQGRWRYVNYAAVHQCLKGLAQEDVVTALLRMAFDLSFERKGALLCIFCDDTKALKDAVPDWKDQGCANSVLRNTLHNNCQISDWQQRQIVTAAATVDGAVVISAQGIVLDVACMIGPPNEARKQKYQAMAPSEPGARSGAAWRASLFGAAIKISEDGPITIYVRGKKAIQIG